MADSAPTELDAFRAETRAWLEENYPPSLNEPMAEDEAPWGGRRAVWSNPDAKLWLDRMAAKGWTAPTWPKAYGGGGLNADQNRALQQELARLKARPALMSFGVWMLGPVLLEYASEAQKQKFLPIIRSGNGKFFGFGESNAPGMDKMEGRFAQILPPKPPTDEHRALAHAVLKVKGVNVTKPGTTVRLTPPRR